MERTSPTDQGEEVQSCSDPHIDLLFGMIMQYNKRYGVLATKPGTSSSLVLVQEDWSGRQGGRLVEVPTEQQQRARGEEQSQQSRADVRVEATTAANQKSSDVFGIKTPSSNSTNASARGSVIDWRILRRVKIKQITTGERVWYLDFWSVGCIQISTERSAV